MKFAGIRPCHFRFSELKGKMYQYYSPLCSLVLEALKLKLLQRGGKNKREVLPMSSCLWVLKAKCVLSGSHPQSHLPPTPPFKIKEKKKSSLADPSGS